MAKKFCIVIKVEVRGDLAHVGDPQLHRETYQFDPTPELFVLNLRQKNVLLPYREFIVASNVWAKAHENLLLRRIFNTRKITGAHFEILFLF